MPRKVRVRTYISPDLRDRFAAQFPGNGGLSWLLETAVRELLELTDGQPTVQQLVRRSIRAAIIRERLTLKTERTDEPKPIRPNKPSITVEPIEP